MADKRHVDLMQQGFMKFRTSKHAAGKPAYTVRPVICSLCGERVEVDKPKDRSHVSEARTRAWAQHRCRIGWRIQSVGKMYGAEGYYDPRTGYAYDVVIEFEDPREDAIVWITHEHYEWAISTMETQPDDDAWWCCEQMPAWLARLVTPPSGDQ